MSALPNFTEQYRTRDTERAEWGPGPWDDEPDKAVWTDAATGLAAMVVRGPSGALCGYVGLPEAHPWHGLGYGECTLPEPCGDEFSWCDHCPGHLLDAHGGITFADGCNDTAPDPRAAICHIDPNGGETFWFGFDCVHSGDYAPGHRFRYGRPGDYRALPYVVAEVRSLARQLSGVSS